MAGDEDTEDYGGFFEAAQNFRTEADRRIKLRSLSDQRLLYYYRTISNPKVIATSSWIPLFEHEIDRRGLKKPS